MEGSCPSVNEKKFLPTSDVLNRGNEGGTGVQMFLDEPETKEGQFRGTKEILPDIKISNPKIFTGKFHRLEELLRKLSIKKRRPRNEITT